MFSSRWFGLYRSEIDPARIGHEGSNVCSMKVEDDCADELSLTQTQYLSYFLVVFIRYFIDPQFIYQQKYTA